jgi:hypothetical protein
MKIVIIAYGPVSGSYTTDGEYVKSYDVEAHDGRGDVTFTKNVADAMTFADMPSAVAFTMRQPASRPLRADGKPNRPLTAFTLELKNVDR